jgi:hypothetical protein
MRDDLVPGFVRPRLVSPFKTQARLESEIVLLRHQLRAA